MQDIAHDFLKTFRPLPVMEPERPVDLPPALDGLSAEDARRFMTFGWGPVVTPRFATIIDAIDHNANLLPEAIAVEYQGQRISYGELDAAANRFASVLTAHGVRRADAVCLYLSRSIEMVVGIVAILRAGAAYVPQHVGVAPATTLRHVAGATGATAILTTRAHTAGVPVASHQSLITIDTIMSDPALSAARPEGPDFRAWPEDRCMVLFTSGTTGVPNGVQVSHANLCNILQTAPCDLGMRPGLRVGQILSIGFDMAAWETLGALSNGATLVIQGKSIQETAEQVDVLIATPSILNSIDQSRCGQVRTVAVVGGPCPRPLADSWSSFCTFYDSCGPTSGSCPSAARRRTTPSTFWARICARC
ncbi:MAG: AMP-binding protein [Rhodobacteraceae bacterium]|nr:AMP-binding protein [Paracoccaceae bacterium]